MVTFAQDISEGNKPEVLELGEIFWGEDIEYAVSNLGFEMLTGTYMLLPRHANVGIEFDLDMEDLEDLADALEAEAEYLAKGKDAFMGYDQYRARRLRQGV